jgi:C4-type Zn-finger protein
MDEDAIQQFLDQSADWIILDKDEMLRECPVCSGTGISHERAGKVSMRVPNGQGVVRGWVATDFRCSICKLTLESEAFTLAAPHFESVGVGRG